MKKRFLALLLAAMLLVICAVPAMAAAPKVKKVDYEDNGIIEVDFKTNNVRYKNVKVVVKDPDGNALPTRILEKDRNDITFRVTGMAAATKYTYKISGVRAGTSGSFGSVSGSFTTPSNAPTIKRVIYDRQDKELEVEFATRVQFKGLKVSIVDQSGKSLTVKKLQKGSDDLEMKVSGMVAGHTYTITVSGVRVKGVGHYVTVNKTFVA